MLRINVCIVIECIEENETICEQERFILILEMLRILFSICQTELFNNPLDLVSFAWKAERGQEFTDGVIDRLSFIFKT